MGVVSSLKFQYPYRAVSSINARMMTAALKYRYIPTAAFSHRACVHTDAIRSRAGIIVRYADMDKSIERPWASTDAVSANRYIPW